MHLIYVYEYNDWKCIVKNSLNLVIFQGTNIKPSPTIAPTISTKTIHWLYLYYFWTEHYWTKWRYNRYVYLYVLIL